MLGANEGNILCVAQEPQPFSIAMDMQDYAFITQFFRLKYISRVLEVISFPLKFWKYYIQGKEGFYNVEFMEEL